MGRDGRCGSGSLFWGSERALQVYSRKAVGDATHWSPCRSRRFKNIGRRTIDGDADTEGLGTEIQIQQTSRLDRREAEQFLTLYRSGVEMEDIATILNRTVSACQNHFTSLPWKVKREASEARDKAKQEKRMAEERGETESRRMLSTAGRDRIVEGTMLVGEQFPDNLGACIPNDPPPLQRPPRHLSMAAPRPLDTMQPTWATGTAPLRPYRPLPSLPPPLQFQKWSSTSRNSE